MKYAVLFANHSWSGASGIIAIKDTLDEAIVVATKEVNDVMKKNDIDMTIDECIAEEKTISKGELNNGINEKSN